MNLKKFSYIFFYYWYIFCCVAVIRRHTRACVAVLNPKVSLCHITYTHTHTFILVYPFLSSNSLSLFPPPWSFSFLSFPFIPIFIIFLFSLPWNFSPVTKITIRKKKKYGSFFHSFVLHPHIQ